MDLGLKGKKAIVCAASKGLGKASALSLAREGVDLVITARGAEALEQAADEIRAETGVTVTLVAGDIKTPEGRAQALAACPEPDILINNAGGPPRGDFRDFKPEDWVEAVNGNMITAIELIKATVDGMMARKFGRIVNITSAAVRQPIHDLCLSNAARAGLTGFCAGLARETVRHNVTINNILPGPFATDRLLGPIREKGEDEEAALAEIGSKNPAGRVGYPDEFGDACAFLCSAKSGFITGQNLLLDGGNYRGTM